MLELKHGAGAFGICGVGDCAVESRFVVCCGEGVGDAGGVGLGEGVVNGVVEVLSASVSCTTLIRVG